MAAVTPVAEFLRNTPAPPSAPDSPAESGYVVVLPDTGRDGGGRSLSVSVEELLRKEPGISVAEAERRAMSDDPTRAWRGVKFDPSPLGVAHTVPVLIGVSDGSDGRRPILGEQVRRDRANHGICRNERVKGDSVLPADPPSVFETQEEAAQTVERYTRLGEEQALPHSSYLRFAGIVTVAEYKRLTGTVAADLKAQESAELVRQAELEAEEAQARLRAVQASLEQVKPATPTAPAENGKGPSPDWSAALTENGDKIPSVQWRTRGDDTVYRARHKGSLSETFDSLGAAQAWIYEARA